MPKPKRPRPPVVKTDWVVEEHRDGRVQLTLQLESKAAIGAWVHISKQCDRDRGTKTIFKAYQRKWRKVDL